MPENIYINILDNSCYPNYRMDKGKQGRRGKKKEKAEERIVIFQEKTASLVVLDSSAQ